MIGKRILELVDYGLKNGLLEKEDRIYTVNRLLELFGLDEPEEGDISPIKAGAILFLKRKRSWKKY